MLKNFSCVGPEFYRGVPVQLKKDRVLFSIGSIDLVESLMQAYSITRFRRELFQVADTVLRTGASVEVIRHGKKLLLCLPERPISRLSKLKRRHGLKGNPEDLVALQVGKWNELKNLQ